MEKYALLIPAYNAAKTIPGLLKEIDGVKPQPAITIVVDDGSTDETISVLSDFAVTVLSYPENRGKGATIRLGFNYLKQQKEISAVVCMDADRQHKAQDIPRFLSALSHSGDVIIGKRARRPGKMPLARIFSNSISSWLVSRLCKQKIKDCQCGFRAFKKAILEDLQLKEEHFQFESEFIIQSCRKNHEVSFLEIDTIYNKNGSHIRHMRDTWEFIRLVIRELKA